jgi:fucose permease
LSVFALSCLTYLSVALPGSTFGLLWPSIRLSIHEPVSALGIVLVAGVLTSVLSSAVTGRLMSRVTPGPLLAIGAALVGASLAMEAAASALWVIVIGSAVFSLGFGTINSALNVYAAGQFSARDINWMHASYGLGATLGPLFVTALLRGGIGWRGTVDSMAGVLALVAVLLVVTRHRWNGGREHAAADRSEEVSPAATPGPAAPRRWAVIIAGISFTTVEIGIESAAGTWGYVFLTAGRGLPAVVAGVAVSAYWAMMFVGRTLLGALAGRLGPSRVLAGAIGCVPAGALLMAVPGPALVAVAGMMVLGLATAPIFPLLTLTTGDRVGASGSTAVALQVAASAVGGAAVPSGIGVIIGAVSAWTLAPALLVLSLAMGGVYWLTLRVGN